MAEKHYDVRLPVVWCGQDMGLPLDPEVRKFLKGFKKNEFLSIADEYDRKVKAGEDPTYTMPTVGIDARETQAETEEQAHQRSIAESLGIFDDTETEVEVESFDEPVSVVDAEEEDSGVPMPEAPAVLETREVAEDESDNYPECDRDDLYEEARRRKLAGVAPKIGKEKLIELLRRDDAKNL